MQKLSDEQRLEIKAVVNPNISELARKYGVSRRTIRRVRGTSGPEFPDYPWPEQINWREYFDTWDQLLELHKRSDPYAERFVLDFGDTDNYVAIVSGSDLHIGGGFTDHKAIKTTMEFIMEHEELTLGVTGDSIEGFIPGMKSAEANEQQISSVKAQKWALQSLVQDLVAAESLAWVGWGDHDALWFERLVGENSIREMLKHKVPYFQGRGLVEVKLADQRYFILANHKEHSRSQWSDTHAARRAYERVFPADVVITGHTHQPEFRMFYHYSELRRAGLPIGGKAWLVQNGAFKTGPDPYTIRGWTRGIIGVPTIVLSPREHEVDVFETPEKALQFIKGAR